ncbi:hypothetical protein HDU82_000188 [Entophlyctis luteolus]|nr:hypothetical protein HDU82_000188 [Entophlyctis luteolus]
MMAAPRAAGLDALALLRGNSGPGIAPSQAQQGSIEALLPTKALATAVAAAVPAGAMQADTAAAVLSRVVRAVAVAGVLLPAFSPPGRATATADYSMRVFNLAFARPRAGGGARARHALARVAYAAWILLSDSALSAWINFLTSAPAAGAPPRSVAGSGDGEGDGQDADDSGYAYDESDAPVAPSATRIVSARTKRILLDLTNRIEAAAAIASLFNMLLYLRFGG